MKSLQKDLQVFVKELKALTLTTERLAKKLANLETAASPKEKIQKAKEATKTEPVRRGGRTKKTSAVDLVFAVIKKSRKGADMTQIKAKTGFNDRKIWNAIYQLKKIGRVKTVQRGVYDSI